MFVPQHLEVQYQKYFHQRYNICGVCYVVLWCLVDIQSPIITIFTRVEATATINLEVTATISGLQSCGYYSSKYDN